MTLRPGKFFDLLILMVLENRGWSEVQNCQFVSAIGKVGTIYDNWTAATHPSGPNYRAITSGQTWSWNEFDGVRREYIGQHVGHVVINWAGAPAQRHNPFLDMSPDDPPVTYGRPALKFATGEDSVGIVYLGMDDNNNGHSGSLDVADKNVMDAIQAVTALTSTKRTTMFVCFDEAYGLEYLNNHVFAGIIGFSAVPGMRDSRSLSHYSLARTLYDNWGVPLNPSADRKCSVPLLGLQ